MREDIQENFSIRMVPLGSLMDWYDYVSSGMEPQCVNISLIHLEGILSISIKKLECYPFFCNTQI